MASLEYQRDGSIIATNDSGVVLLIPAGPKAVQGAAFLAHFGPEKDVAPKDDPAVILAKMLEQKGILTAKEVGDVSVSATVLTSLGAG